MDKPRSPRSQEIFSSPKWMIYFPLGVGMILLSQILKTLVLFKRFIKDISYFCIG